MTPSKAPTPDDVLALVSSASSSVTAATAVSSAPLATPEAQSVVAAAAAAAAAVSQADTTMQQLLLQVQAQQAQLHMAHADAQFQAAAMAAAALQQQQQQQLQLPPAQQLPTQPPGAARATNGNLNIETSVSSTSMDLMPLSAAAVVIGSPTNGGPDGSLLRRKSIPLSMKKEAIEWIMGPGKGIPSRAEKHFAALNWDVSASSYRKWWKNRDRIMNDSSTKKRVSGGGRKPYLEEAEEKLLVIVIQERAKKDRVTRKWIAKTAQHMFQRTNGSFKASENWVTKFIRRNGLTLKRSYVTYDHAEDGAAALSGDVDDMEDDAATDSHALGIHAESSLLVHAGASTEDDTDDAALQDPKPPSDSYVDV